MIDKSQIYQWWDVFKSGSDLTEIRILDGKKTYSGYFKDIETLIRCVEPFDQLPNAQIYFTVNHVKNACYDRGQKDRIIQITREPTTSDVDVDGRTHVLIDLDPKRPAGVGASDQELNAAYNKAIEIYKWLLSQGFNEPIVCRSGNGYHLYIPCSISASDETTEIVKRFLQVLSLFFSDENIEVDEKVFNLARISKLPGTMARKGGNTKSRPWRSCQIVKVPSEIKATDIAYFRKIAAMYPEDNRPTRYNGYTFERFDLVDFLHKHNIEFTESRVAGGTKYILDHCPFNDQHKHKDAVIFQRDNGAIGFLCFHNSCSGKTWRDVRLLFEPDAYEKDYIPQPQMSKPIYRQPLSQTVVPLQQTEEKGKIWLKMSEIKKPKIDPADYIPSGIPVIDRRALGFRRGNVTVWSGFRGCGKTSLLDMLALNAAQKGYKSAKWSGEMLAEQEKQWMYLQAAGKQYNRRYSTTDFYYTPDNISDKIDPWIDKYIWLFNNKYGDNFQQISDQVHKLKDDEDIDNVFLDNLMVLNFRELDGDKLERQGILLQKLQDLAKELLIHIHLVAHPRKSSGYLRIDDISGSGDIGNKADNVFILSRVNNDFKNNANSCINKIVFNDIMSSGCTNVIEIGKFRNKGSIVGEFIKLWFELESNRLKNDIAESITYNWNDEAVEGGLPFDAPSEDSDLPF